MSTEDLEKFRDEWKAELHEDRRTNHGPESSSPNDFRGNHQKQNALNSESCINPAFRESSNLHTRFLTNEHNNDEKSNTKFYPFRIVDELLSPKDVGKSASKAVNIELNSLLNKKCKAQKRKAVRDLKEDWNSLSGKKVMTEKDSPDASERYLDLFIADLNEINEIPFFDLTIPREVAVKIFEPLDMIDLCRCSQVSKSWKSLADDELLWCRICHQLGYDLDTHSVERTRWKSVVRSYVERERKLDYNWKNRLGSFSQLQHVHGGILCAVGSCGDDIVAGYSNGEVKLWNTADQYELIFQPSNTSLVVDESTEDGMITNNVHHVAVSKEFVVAGYRQGNVDIWKTGDNCTTSVHVIECHDSRGVMGVGVAQNSDLVYAVTGPRDIGAVHICQDYSTEKGFRKSKILNIPNYIKKAMILEDACDNTVPALVIATPFKVDLYTTESCQEEIFSHMTNVHNVIGSPVTCMDVRSSPCQLAVGLGSFGGSLDPYRVKIYDVKTNRLISTVMNHSWTVTCVNIADSPEHLMVTGSGDRRVRVFDLRSEDLIHQFPGHSSQVNTVQMDEVKVISGGDDGFVRVWDLRMAKKLWEIHNRHPVRHCHFTKDRLILGNVPSSCMPVLDEFESVTHRRYRGSIQVYDFSVDQTTQGVPDICLSTYDEPLASQYNISLAVPYDNL